MQTNTSGRREQNQCHRWLHHAAIGGLTYWFQMELKKATYKHMVSHINWFERPAEENCDVHPKKTTLDITFHFL
jgi:hypothetical protein